MADVNPIELVRAAQDGDGFGGGNGWWIILLFLFLGWGNGGWGGNGAAAAEAASIYPIMENQQNLFTGFGQIQNALCSGFANAETAATSRQMADMNQLFALQTAMMQGFNQQQAQLAQCCCDNRLATQQLNTTIAQEACTNRQALANNTQLILDWLCDNKIDQKNDEIAQLRTQLQVQNLAASQVAQTAEIINALKPAATS